MEEQLLQLKNDALSLILETESPKELEEVKLQFLGRNGKLTLAFKNIIQVPLEQRVAVGKFANEVKTILEDAITEREQMLKKQTHEARKSKIDVTNPGIKPTIGHLHPMTHVLNEVVEIFKEMGFQAADGPEIETDHYNFEVLNIPKNHPARDTQQTLYLDTRNSHVSPGEVILRTHGSNMQGRVMEKITPPCRVIYPGKVFRYEPVDASHGFEFWQNEGLAVGKGITMTDCFGTLDYFLKKFFGKESKVRFVCHNFPFVEPGLEAYVSCSVCKGKGCSFCKHSGWVEILGAGMIHPNVLKAVNIDSQKYSGFAWGMGLSRMVTLKYQMDDLRLLTNPDLRIINQF